MPVTVHHGDALDVLAELPDASVDAVVTDPPYLLSFMGREWDSRPAHEHLAFHGAWAAECLRVLKPGGHLLAFGGTRTWHRLACAIEDAGFEVRDNIAWLYGQGFPKSLNVGKAVEAALTTGGSASRNLRRVEQEGKGAAYSLTGRNNGIMGEVRTYDRKEFVPATPAARQWQGWGTALKPAFEPIVVARKPLAGTVAANVLAHGTGALNIDACRMESGPPPAVTGRGWSGARGYGVDVGDDVTARPWHQPAGRWPTNVALDDTTADQLDTQTGVTRSRIGAPRGAAGGDGWRMSATGAEYDDEGGASRFFPVFRYEPKAPTGQRPTAEGDGNGTQNYGGYRVKACDTCDTRFPSNVTEPPCGHGGWSWQEPRDRQPGYVAHPTVKPLDLMRWLVRLVTPPGGTVLDPFAGSGTTGHAAALEGFDAILIEREADYLPLIAARLNAARWGATVVRHTIPPPAPDGSQTLALFDLEAPA